MTKFDQHRLAEFLRSSPLAPMAAAEEIVKHYRETLAPDEVFGEMEKLRPRASRQFWSETVSWAVASGTAVANTVTETILFPNVTIPANFMQDGRCLRLRAFGGYGTTATPSLIFSLRWGGVGGTVIAKQAVNVTTSGVGGGASMTAAWDIEAIIQTRSNGSTGTLFTSGLSHLYTSTLLTAGTVTNYGQTAPLVSGSTGGTTPVAVTADLTADTALALTVTWGTANAANSIQGHQYTIEALN